MKRIILILIVQLLIITACNSNENTAYEEYEHEDFNEKIIYEDIINPDIENLGNLAFNNEGKVILEDNVSRSIYHSEASKIIFNFENSNYETDGNFEDWYLEKVTDNGEEEYKICFSEIEGATAEKFGGKNVDFDVGAFMPAEGGEVYPLENGNLMVVIYYPDLSCKVVEIDLFKRKLIKMAEYDMEGVQSYALLIRFVTEKYTIFSDTNNGDLLYYNNYTLNQDKQTKSPGCIENKVFGTSKFKLYNGYLYTVNDSGIYRNNQVDAEWENIINASETETLSVDENISCIDLLLESESDIYVLKTTPGEIEGTTKVSIIKFELK